MEVAFGRRLCWAIVKYDTKIVEARGNCSSQLTAQSNFTPYGTPVTPAEAGVQSHSLDSGFRRNDELDHYLPSARGS